MNPSGSVIQTLETGLTYPVMEHFYTIQGEGAFTGQAAYFIRLAGCDVGCWWCDVKESWDRNAHPDLDLHELIEVVQQSDSPRTVITGGEPLLHDLQPLTKALRDIGQKTHIETSGSSPFSGDFDWVTLSPKRFKPPLEESYERTHELKVVIVTKKDFLWAEQHAAKCPPETQLYFQPEWDSPKTIPWIVDYVKDHPKWQISLQTHKFLNVP